MPNEKKQSTKSTKKMDGEIWHREECCEIQGALFEVYREMGCGFLEAVYQERLEKGLFKRGIPFVAHQVLRLFYKGGILKQTFTPDYICHESIIVELSAFCHNGSTEGAGTELS